MAVLIDAATERLSRTANLGTNTAFTIAFWARIAADRGTGVLQPLFFSLDAGSTDGPYLIWEGAGVDGSAIVGCLDGGTVSSETNFASRPAIGEWAFWYIRCSGTGAGLLQGGWRGAASNSFVTASATMGSSVAAMASWNFGSLLDAYYSEASFRGVKAWNRALSDAELLVESFFDRPQFPASINFWWPLPNVNDVADRSGNGRNPTVGGSPTTADSGGQAWKPSRKILLPRAASATNYTLTCDVGSYSLTGVAALLRRVYSLVGDPGSYTLAGQDAALRRGYQLAADPGSYVLAGQDAALRRGYSLALDTGAYSLAGNDATLTYSAGATAYSLVCDAGAYSLTGYDAGLTYTPGPSNYSITGDAGSYALSGNAAGLTFGRRLVLDSGSYGLGGQAAALIYGRRLVCDTGVYALAGNDADLIFTTTGPVAYSLACEPGAYVLSGRDASLVYTDGSTPAKSHGFVITDTAPRLWWQRKPKALDEEEAEQKVARVVRVVERIAQKQVEAVQPAPAKEQKREVREAIAPLVAEMPGFDWMTLYRVILIELGRRQQEQQAAELAQMEIARIQAMKRDEDDLLILLMSI